jgi:hypothetical protein
MSPGLFLAAVATLSLANKTSSQMPASAVAMLDRWNKKQATLSIADAAADLSALAASSERVTRGRRMLPILLGTSPVVLMLIAAVFAMRMTSPKTGTGRLFTVLGLLKQADKETDPHYRKAYETYVAGTYQAELTNDALWKAFKDTDDKDKELPRLRETATRVAAMHPTPEETAAAAYVIQPALDKIELQKNNAGGPTIFIVLVFVGCGMTFFSELVSVLARPSGIVLSAMGLAVIAASGREISRFRAVLRLLIAWLPMAIFTVLRIIPSTAPWMTQSMIPAAIALAFMAAGVIWTTFRPTRGPHDIVARTTIGVR